ncbi:MAG: hypothetical protein ACE5GE_17055 [Phycisphaerae bacterium]
MSERVSIRASLGLVLGVALVGSGACRKHQPPPPVARNLGTADRPLVPVARLAGDREILKGRAAPIRASDISDEEIAQADAKPDEAAAAQELSEEDADLLEELVELIATAAAEENYDELGDYLVEDHRDAVLTLVQAGRKLDTALADFDEALPDDATDSRSQAKALLADAAGGTGLFAVLAAMAAEPPDDGEDSPASAVTLVSLRMTDSDTAAGALTTEGLSLPVEFALIDDEWFMRLPDTLVDLETVEAVNGLADLLASKLGDLTDRLDDGSLDAGDVGAEIATASSEVKSAATELAPVVKRLEALAQAEASGDVLPAGEEPSKENTTLIEELVELFGEAITERRFGDLIELFVPDQQDRAEALYPAIGRLLIAADGLADALEDSDAESADQVRIAAGMMAPTLSTEDLRMTGPNQAMAVSTHADRPVPVHYEYVDDEWYYSNSALPADADQAKALADRLTDAADQIEDLTGQVEDDSVAGADVLTKFQAIILGLRPQAEDKPESEEQADENDDDQDGDHDEADDDHEAGDHDEADDDHESGDDHEADGDDQDSESPDDDQADEKDKDSQAAPATPPAKPKPSKRRGFGN